MRRLAFLAAFSMMALFVFAPAAVAQDEVQEEFVEEVAEIEPAEPVEPLEEEAVEAQQEAAAEQQFGEEKVEVEDQKVIPKAAPPPPPKAAPPPPPKAAPPPPPEGCSAAPPEGQGREGQGDAQDRWCVAHVGALACRRLAPGRLGRYGARRPAAQVATRFLEGRGCPSRFSGSGRRGACPLRPLRVRLDAGFGCTASRRVGVKVSVGG